jgi:hypothetical protein
MEIYDFVTADSVEATDQIVYGNDYIELSDVIDSGDAIMVKGYSHVSGDSVTYLLTPDSEVGLWTA